MHCQYCKKEVKHQNNWARHLKTKRHLKNVEKIDGVKVQQPIIIKQTEEITYTETSSYTSEPRRFLCEYCERSYKHKSSLKNHKCKGKPKLSEDDKDKTIKELRDMINLLINDKKGDTTNNNTNNITNTINNIDNRSININMYGKEDFKGIMDDELSTKMIDLVGCNQILLELYLKESYINKKENRTIEYNNFSRNICKVHKGEDEWQVDDINSVIDKRIRMSKQILPKMLKGMDDYEECKDAYGRVISSNKEFINNKTSKGYNQVKQTHKRDIYNSR